MRISRRAFLGWSVAAGLTPLARAQTAPSERIVMGVIGLQIHSGPAAEAHYKDIQIVSILDVEFRNRFNNTESTPSPSVPSSPED